jgi:hypothetical protein
MTHRVSMRERAQEAGHCIIHQTSCWHCTRHVFLYASETGGFTIFDSLSPLWHLHGCVGWIATDEYRHSSGKLPTTGYRLHSSSDAPVDLTNGGFLRGIVVGVANYANRCVVANGSSMVLCIPSSCEMQIGQSVQGMTRRIGNDLFFDVNVCNEQPDVALSEPMSLAISRADNLTFSWLRNTWCTTRVVYWCIVDERLDILERFPYKQKAEAEARLRVLQGLNSRWFTLIQKKL